jgi:hypothetical protein
MNKQGKIAKQDKRCHVKAAQENHRCGFKNRSIEKVQFGMWQKEKFFSGQMPFGIKLWINPTLIVRNRVRNKLARSSYYYASVVLRSAS